MGDPLEVDAAERGGLSETGQGRPRLPLAPGLYKPQGEGKPHVGGGALLLLFLPPGTLGFWMPWSYVASLETTPDLPLQIAGSFTADLSL